MKQRKRINRGVLGAQIVIIALSLWYSFNSFFLGEFWGGLLWLIIPSAWIFTTWILRVEEKEEKCFEQIIEEGYETEED